MAIQHLLSRLPGINNAVKANSVSSERFITSFPGGVQSIAVSISVLGMYLCLSAHISPKPHVQTSRYLRQRPCIGRPLTIGLVH